MQYSTLTECSPDSAEHVVHISRNIDPLPKDPKAIIEEAYPTKGKERITPNTFQDFLKTLDDETLLAIHRIDTIVDYDRESCRGILELFRESDTRVDVDVFKKSRDLAYGLLMRNGLLTIEKGKMSSRSVTIFRITAECRKVLGTFLRFAKLRDADQIKAS